MLWYKSWLETRWRFLIGLALLLITASGTVFGYLTVVKLMPLARTLDTSGEIGRKIKEAVEIEREFRGFVWLQWFRQNLTQMGTLFAVLLGSGGLLSGSAGAALFTLSLPVSRARLLTVRAATGLAQLLVLAVVPSLVIPLLSPAVGQHYSVADALVHGACMFIASSAFFSLAFLLSTVFSDVWRPALIAIVVATILAFCELMFRDLAGYGVFGVMSGEAYFRAGRAPWGGLLVSMGASAAMLYAAALNIARRDF
jgi:ABC-2 type transport system permease protein